MIKVASLLLFTLTSQPLWAIGDLLKELDSVGKTSLDCSQMSHDELAKECTQEVCGTPKSITVSAAKASEYLSEQDNKKMQKLERNLRDYYQQLQDDISALVSDFNSQKDKPLFADLSSWKDQDFEQIMDYFWVTMSIDVDYSEKLDKRKIKLHTPPSNPHYHAFKELVTNFDIKEDPYRSMAFGLITDDEFKMLAQKKISEYEEALGKQKKSTTLNFNQFRFMMSSGGDPEIIKKFFDEMRRDAQRNGIQIVPHTCGVECKKAAKALIKTIDPGVIKRDLENILKRLNIEDRVAMCKASFLAANIENTKQNDFAKRWPEIKKGFNTNVFPHFSEHSRQLLQNYLDNELNFFYDNPHKQKFNEPNIPTSSIRTGSSHKDLINNTLSLLTNKLEVPECSPRGEPIYKVWDAFASKELVNNNPSFRPKGLALNRDNIAVSPFSCEHQREGDGIVAHEVGHAISAVMARDSMSKNSRKAYINWRKCVVNKWKEQPKAQRIYHQGDKFYTEEDTADLISYMAVPDATSPYGCSLLRPNEKSFTDLSAQVSAYDNHTPGIIRLLREIKYKAPGRIPATCAEIMKRNNDKIGKICLPAK